MRRRLAALILMIAASGADAEPEDGRQLIGWWHARVAHAGESDDVYLHFTAGKGGIAARFSIPTIGADDAPLGAATVTDQAVNFPDAGWSLRRENGGRVLAGTMAEGMVPYYKLETRFERSGPPRPALVDTPPGPPPKPLWKRVLGSAVYAGLAVDPRNGLLIVGTDSGRVVALRSNNGRQAWSLDAGAPIRATPSIGRGYVYVPTDAALLKIDARSGRRLWSAPFRRSTVKRLELSDPASRWDFYGSSAVESGKTVYAGALDGCVYAFRTDTGSRIRRFCAKDSITGTPLVTGGRVYFGSFDGHVYAARLSDGQILWKHDTHGAVTSDLALAAGNVIAGSRSYDLTALTPATGAPAWTRYFWFSWVESSPSVVGGVIYIGSSDGRRVSAFDGGSGGRLWESRLPGWAWAKPAIGRQAVYASVAGTTQPYIGKRDGGFAAIDRSNGRLRWIIRTATPEKAAVYGFASAPVVAVGRVFAADLDGNVFAFKED